MYYKDDKLAAGIILLIAVIIAFAGWFWQKIIADNLRSELQTLQKQRDEFFSRDPTINKLYCQQFRSETERATNEWYLRKERYQAVHAMEIDRAFEMRSSGDLELIDQTNLECFYDKWMTQKFPAHTYYSRKIQKPRGVK